MSKANITVIRTNKIKDDDFNVKARDIAELEQMMLNSKKPIIECSSLNDFRLKFLANGKAYRYDVILHDFEEYGKMLIAYRDNPNVRFSLSR